MRGLGMRVGGFSRQPNDRPACRLPEISNRLHRGEDRYHRKIVEIIVAQRKPRKPERPVRLDGDGRRRRLFAGDRRANRARPRDERAPASRTRRPTCRGRIRRDRSSAPCARRHQGPWATTRARWPPTTCTKTASLRPPLHQRTCAASRREIDRAFGSTTVSWIPPLVSRPVTCPSTVTPSPSGAATNWRIIPSPALIPSSHG